MKAINDIIWSAEDPKDDTVSVLVMVGVCLEPDGDCGGGGGGYDYQPYLTPLTCVL